MSNILEIGPGRGDFLFHLAETNPSDTVHAIEHKKKRVEKLVKRLEKNKLTNVVLHLGDAKLLLPKEFTDESLSKIFILFSDPWPKARHARHRLFQDSFARELIRVLKLEGQLYIATDDLPYLLEIREVFRKFIDTLAFSPKGVQFMTFYADKWVKEGRKLYSFSYQKKGNLFFPVSRALYPELAGTMVLMRPLLRRWVSSSDLGRSSTARIWASILSESSGPEMLRTSGLSAL